MNGNQTLIGPTNNPLESFIIMIYYEPFIGYTRPPASINLFSSLGSSGLWSILSECITHNPSLHKHLIALESPTFAHTIYQ